MTITVRELAEVLNVSLPTAYASVREGHVPSIRVSANRVIVPTAALLKMLGEALDVSAGMNESPRLAEASEEEGNEGVDPNRSDRQGSRQGEQT